MYLENSEDLEKLQKCATRIIMENDEKNYEDALQKIGIDSLTLSAMAPWDLIDSWGGTKCPDF